jgi:hypothetical protein
MKKQILEQKVYYYEDCIKDFDNLMKTIDELDEMEKSEKISSWLDWTASNDKTFIYGLTKTYDLNQIKNMKEPYKSKMLFVYNTIFDSFYEVCKDYAIAMGDLDEPNLFPVFNIKKYNAGVGMGSHFDQNDGDITLRYSFNIYLNDDFDGGEVSFTLSEYKEVGMQPSPDLDYDIALKNNSIDFAVKPKIARPQRCQIQHHGFDRLFNLHRNATAFGQFQTIEQIGQHGTGTVQITP